MGERCAVESCGEDIATDWSCAAVSDECSGECAFVIEFFIAKKDADDSCLSCVEETVMKSGFWVVLSKKEVESRWVVYVVANQMKSLMKSCDVVPAQSTLVHSTI
jgi:hypothetical protein